jgi:hypothetical protein
MELASNWKIRKNALSRHHTPAYKLIPETSPGMLAHLVFFGRTSLAFVTVFYLIIYGPRDRLRDQMQVPRHRCDRSCHVVLLRLLSGKSELLLIMTAWSESSP